MSPKEKLSSTEYQSHKAPAPYPPAWRMEPYLSNLIDAFGPKSEIAIQINLFMLDYSKKCAKAEIELTDAIQKLMKSKL